MGGKEKRYASGKKEKKSGGRKRRERIVREKKNSSLLFRSTGLEKSPEGGEGMEEVPRRNKRRVRKE